MTANADGKYDSKAERSREMKELRKRLEKCRGFQDWFETAWRGGLTSKEMAKLAGKNVQVIERELLARKVCTAGDIVSRDRRVKDL